MIYPVLTYSRNLGDFTHDLAELYRNGLKSIRLIYKGKTEAEFNQRIKEIQEVIVAKKMEIDILIDLPGKKPIVGQLPQGLNVESGVVYTLIDQETTGSSSEIPTLNFFDHHNFSSLEIGDIISIADDELNLEIRSIHEDNLVCQAINSFHLTANRSMGLKNKPFPITANSEADLSFVRNTKELRDNVKLLVSFTEKAEDLLQLKALQPEATLVAKIETIIDDTELIRILESCESVMLGRGDLSLVCAPNELFAFQQKLIDWCRQHNKPLIIGTGLLTGIGDKGSPSIAEIADYSYLRQQGIEGFLIAGTNANTHPLQTLAFMREFEL